MKLSRREVLIAAGALALPRVARADDAETDALLAKVAAARASVKSLRGTFTQSRKIGLLATEVRSTGTITLVCPDRLRWELAPPDEITYWVVPEGLAYKSKSGHGRVRGGGHRIAAALEDLRAVLGGDLGALRKRYDVSGSVGEGGRATFVARARGGAGGAGGEARSPGEAAAMQRIELELASDLARPTRAILSESKRDRVQIVFGPLERDAPIDPSLMKPAF